MLYFLNIHFHRYEKIVNTQIMTIKEVSEYLKLAEKTAYRLSSQGKIPAFKIGGSWRFDKADIDKWIEKQKAVQPKEVEKG